MLILIILAFLPGLLWLRYFYRKDQLEPEPKRLIFRMFGVGLLTFFPAAILELPFSRFHYPLVFIIAPIVEELCKFLAVRQLVYKNREFDEPMDGIVYAASVALGFASLENLGYLIEALNSGVFISTYVLRAILSVPGHVLFSSMWGYTLGLSKFAPTKFRHKMILQGLILSVVVHGVFNFFATISAIFAVGMLGFIFFLWKMVNQRIRRAFRISQHTAARHQHVFASEEL